MKTLVSKIYKQIPVIRELQEIKQLLISNQRRLLETQVIGMIDFELKKHSRYSDPQRLPSYHAQICSQNGEDGIIHEIFSRIGTKTKDFVEIGVGSGYENNTAFLLSQGWKGFWIDGNNRFLKVLKNRADIRKENRLRYLVDFVTSENIIPLFEKLNVPKEFDLLSLDIDMNTYYVWQSLHAFRPRVVVIEYNAAIPPDIDWKVSYHPKSTWDGTQNFGASLKALELLGDSMGYSLVGCDILGINAFFVRNDLAEGNFLKPFTSENHYEPPRYSMIHKRTHMSTFLDSNS